MLGLNSFAKRELAMFARLRNPKYCYMQFSNDLFLYLIFKNRAFTFTPLLIYSSFKMPSASTWLTCMPVYGWGIWGENQWEIWKFRVFHAWGCFVEADGPAGVERGEGEAPAVGVALGRRLPRLLGTPPVGRRPFFAQPGSSPQLTAALSHKGDKLLVRVTRQSMR